jgi:hypothetical protein
MVLATIITLLALADGVLHFALDFVLFRGNLFGRLGPPPGAPAPPPGGGGAPQPLPVPLALNQLFALNIVGYLVLVLVFWFVASRRPAWRWLMDLILIAYVAVICIGWLRLGGPNPQGLGYLSKTMEVILVLALLTDLWTSVTRPRTAPGIPARASG